jgi:hypothetical protein
MAARALVGQVEQRLEFSGALGQLPAPTREALVGDLRKIRNALSSRSQPMARPMETVASLRNRLGGASQPSQESDSGSGEGQTNSNSAPSPRRAATETLAARAGALSDEINFPAFVASLVHGTFDAIVDAAIRQMESFAGLVGAVARNTDEFTRDNVTSNQARDWLVERYPKDLQLDTSGPPKVVPKPPATNGEADISGTESEAPSPAWLADFGLEGQELTPELVEEELVPAARQRVGESRLQMLATMVLLGMNRINVRDGSITARVRFRAAATDRVGVQYAATQDPGGGTSWGTRGSASQVQHAMMVSTVGVNAQADTDLKAELFGEVKINFVSETLPLDRFVDQARITLLERNSRTRAAEASPTAGATAPAPAPTTPAPAPPAQAPPPPAPA